MPAGPRQRSLVLIGGKAAASTFRDYVRLSLAGAWLFGPMRWRLLTAARMGARRRHRAEDAWFRHARAALRIEVVLSGIDHIDPREHYVVVPLHEGFADPLVLGRLPLDLTYAVRDELFTWSLLGTYLRASGQVSIPTREGSAGYRALLRAAPDVFARGGSLVIFPQGSILGVEAAFQEGAARVAERLGRPLLPVVITGSHRVWGYPYQPAVALGRTVHVEVLPPIAASAARRQFRTLERTMKRSALDHDDPQPRRFDPGRDGWWDGYPYEIDLDFGDLAQRVRRHRASRAATETPWT